MDCSRVIHHLVRVRGGPFMCGKIPPFTAPVEESSPKKSIRAYLLLPRHSFAHLKKLSEANQPDKNVAVYQGVEFSFIKIQN